MQVPEGKVHAQVRNGLVTLDGHVSFDHQRREVERMVRQVRGVIAVTDTITVKPPASPQKVQEVIEDAFKREAEVDARHISVGVSDHTAKLYGHVHSFQEATAARAAAASAPGTRRELSRGLPGAPPCGDRPPRRSPQPRWRPAPSSEPRMRRTRVTQTGVTTAPFGLILRLYSERTGGGSQPDAPCHRPITCIDTRSGPRAVASEVFSVNGLAILVKFCLGGRHG